MRERIMAPALLRVLRAGGKLIGRPWGVKGRHRGDARRSYIRLSIEPELNKALRKPLSS